MMEGMPPFLIGAVVTLFGLALGSFIGMCAYRLPRGAGIVRKRSHCPGCDKAIPVWRNIPLLSYAVQGGRCFACKGAIHWRYPVSEALCALLVWACWRTYGNGLNLAAGTVICCFLVLLSVVDAEHRKLPDRLTLPLLWLGLIFSLTEPAAPFAAPPQAIAGAAGGYSLLYGANGLWGLLRKRAAFGGGDLKLVAALGAWFGPYGALAAIAIAAVTGTLYAVASTLFTRASPNDELPFGPFLMLGSVCTLLIPNPLWAA
ncbi:MAG: prepilin peptidase [Gammaproteobacteria bacterium]|nr:prepilin peptidase [Gammaproteobacteria bacterium]MYJ76509.1 prepilin peptidase [Gammaproteobacteria bacterium]